MKPGSLEIVAVTDEYLKATMTREGDIVGKRLFEVFPDDPEDPQTDGVKSLAASLTRVQSLKVPDVMGVQRYPVRLPGGAFEERFWCPVNSPVLDEAGEIEFIMHRVEDITSIVKGSSGSQSSAEAGVIDPSAVQDILLRSIDLRQALSKLQEYEARMRTAERLLNLGAWEFNVQSGQLSWSEQVFKIYHVAPGESAPSFEDYFALVHPDDRQSARKIYDDFVQQRAPQLEFEHRVTARHGSVKYIKGVGERHVTSGLEVLVGYVQDITPLIQTREKLSQAERLLRLAGEKARLGGWRVELEPEKIIWTAETAAIHGMPAEYSPPDVASAIEYYAPEYRGAIQHAFELCVTEGTTFDIVSRLQVADGEQPWVRAIGIAERDALGRIVAVQGAFQDITTLHEAQARAEESESRRLDVLESISDGFLAVDHRSIITYINLQGSTILGRARDQLLGKNLWEEFPKAVGSEFQRQYARATEEQSTTRVQAYYPPLDMWLDVSAYPLADGLAVYFRDISSERQRLEQLRLIDAALSRQNDIVMITTAGSPDQPGGPRMIYVNDAFERVTGYARSEALGRSPRMLQGPGTDRAQLDRIREALEKRQPVRGDVLNYTKSGSPYWLELDITPLLDDEGHCTHFVAVERDITERRQRDSELRRNKERLELISKATNDVIWDWDFISGTVWWNDSITHVFGYPLSELEPGPESWSSRIRPEDLESVLHGIHQVIEGSESTWRDEYRFIKSDGQSAHVVDRGFVIRDDSGKAIRMVGSMLDISERLSMEQRLRESQKLETVGHLTGGVAHDFNNLLTVILGNAEMLAEGITDPRLRPLAEMSMDAAQRGAELTNRLLAFARRQPLDPKPTSLNQLVHAMRELVRRTLPEDIELETLLDPALGIAEIDAGELDTALLNLVVNARDAMPGGGKLTIETANVFLDGNYASDHADVVAGSYVMICVSDTGSGMAPETLRRAFEPFFTTKHVGKGSGLGLSMVFGFTKQSGGHIKIYSELGEGTSIKLYFPRVRDARVTLYDPGPERDAEGGTEHILIAEDDDLVIQHLQRMLGSLGYQVTAVRTGPEALDALKANPGIDLLLTDIIMPGGMNGRALADRATELYPSLKVLFTSGYTENAIVHHGRLDPGVELLSKPYTRLELATKVRRVIEGTAG